MSKQAEFAVILKMNAMFADLGADEIQRLSNLCHTQHLSSGEVLFQKGDAGNALFGVRRGQVRIETGASDGSRLTLNFMGPGDLFGEVAVMDGQSRTADATAGEVSELFVLRREDFLAFLEREPKVAIKIIALLCQRIRWQSERMEASMLQPLPDARCSSRPAPPPRLQRRQAEVHSGRLFPRPRCGRSAACRSARSGRRGRPSP